MRRAFRGCSDGERSEPERKPRNARRRERRRRLVRQTRVRPAVVGLSLQDLETVVLRGAPGTVADRWLADQDLRSIFLLGLRDDIVRPVQERRNLSEVGLASIFHVRPRVPRISTGSGAQGVRSIDPLLDELATKYIQLRKDMVSSDARTRKLHQIMDVAAVIQRKVSPQEISTLFQDGNEGQRVIAITLASREPVPEFAGIATEAIERSRSAFEQFLALHLAKTLIEIVDHNTVETLKAAIRSQLSTTITSTDSSRYNIARELLGIFQVEGKVQVGEKPKPRKSKRK